MTAIRIFVLGVIAAVVLYLVAVYLLMAAIVHVLERAFGC